MSITAGIGGGVEDLAPIEMTREAWLLGKLFEVAASLGVPRHPNRRCSRR